jgi:Flp pilus assembly protein TadD
MSPNSAGAEIFLGGALNANGDQDGAERAFNRAVQLAPDSAQVRVALIDFQTARGKSNEALAAARAFGMAHPGPDADLVLANAYIRLKRMNDASTVLTKSLAAKPDARILTRAAQVTAAMGDTKKALGLYTNWLAKNPADSEIRTQYGTLLLSSGNTANAKKEFETVLKQKPDNAVAMNNLSWIIQKEDPKRALELATRSVQISPRSPEMIDTLGWMKLNGADQPGALKLLQRAHDLDGNNPQIGYHLAVALDKSGKRPEAKALLQAVLTKNSTFDGAEEAKQLITRW